MTFSQCLKKCTNKTYSLVSKLHRRNLAKRGRQLRSRSSHSAVQLTAVYWSILPANAAILYRSNMQQRAIQQSPEALQSWRSRKTFLTFLSLSLASFQRDRKVRVIDNYLMTLLLYYFQWFKLVEQLQSYQIPSWKPDPTTASWTTSVILTLSLISLKHARGFRCTLNQAFYRLNCF